MWTASHHHVEHCWQLPVDLAIIVEVFETLEHLLENCRNGGFVKDAMLAVFCFHLVFDDVQQGACKEVLKK